MSDHGWTLLFLIAANLPAFVTSLAGLITSIHSKNLSSRNKDTLTTVTKKLDKIENKVSSNGHGNGI